MAEQHILAGYPPIQIFLRNNPRARRITLRVSARDGRVSLTVPPGVSTRAALDFAAGKRDWLSRHLAEMSGRAPLTLGDTVPVEGETLRLQAAATRAPRREGDLLLIPRRAAEKPGPAVAAFLKVLARERLVPACDGYATQIGRPFSKIALRDTRSRWGSCSNRGSLNFSWRLAMAPPAVLNYVAAHEVAHLREMNHSSAFWALVADLVPDYRAHVAWLRTEGGKLQSIVLDA
ncbi:MAG: SprT family zinc-dependent metalloprotease [Pseudomonadota bacterium]